jgi:uncharacterized paraquat-inducible protein A
MVMSFMSEAILRGDGKRELWGYLGGFYIEFRRCLLSRHLLDLSKIIGDFNHISSGPGRLAIQCIATTQRYIMSRLVAKILLALFMLPLAVILYWTTVMVVGLNLRSSFVGRSEEIVLFDCAGFVTWVFVAIYWFLLWRKSLRWSRSRQYKTFGLTAGLLVFVVLIEISMSGYFNSLLSVASFFGSVLAPLLWLIGTVILWQETPAERRERLTSPNSVSCPVCGYNLTGLTESRCPECGTKFTLDELLASQSAQAIRELD